MIHKIHSKENCEAFLQRKIRKLIKEGYPQKQSLAIAFNYARKKGCKMYRR